MGVLKRIQVTMAGGTMGAGVATHYWASSTTGFQPAVKAFWTSVAAIMSGYVTVTVPTTGEEFDDVTGLLTGSWSEGTGAAITGGGSGSYAGGVGACVGWSTGGIHNGRKVRGRTFIVPLASNTYDSDGSLAAATVTSLNTAAATLVTAGSTKLAIWSRPSVAVPVGGAYPITAGLVKDHVSWLRSRR